MTLQFDPNLVYGLFYVTLQFDLNLVYGQFSVAHFDPWLRNICNAVVIDTPLKRYERNWSIAYDMTLFVIRVVFLLYDF